MGEGEREALDVFRIDTGGRGGHTWQVHCEFVESF